MLPNTLPSYLGSSKPASGYRLDSFLTTHHLPHLLSPIPKTRPIHPTTISIILAASSNSTSYQTRPGKCYAKATRSRRRDVSRCANLNRQFSPIDQRPLLHKRCMAARPRDRHVEKESITSSGFQRCGDRPVKRCTAT
jgi:hypothetical protein